MNELVADSEILLSTLDVNSLEAFLPSSCSACARAAASLTFNKRCFYCHVFISRMLAIIDEKLHQTSDALAKEWTVIATREKAANKLCNFNVEHSNWVWLDAHHLTTISRFALCSSERRERNEIQIFAALKWSPIAKRSSSLIFPGIAFKFAARSMH